MAKPAPTVHPLARCIPLQDYVVILRDRPRTETDKGIILPSGSPIRSQLATVIAAGPDVINKDIAPNERVIIVGFATMNIDDPTAADDDRDRYAILREPDIVALLKRDDE